MRDGERSEVVQSWVESLGQALRQFDVRTRTQEAAFLQLLEQEANRVEGRRARISESTRDLPAPVWFILVLGAGLTIGFTFLFADRREGFLVQEALSPRSSPWSRQACCSCGSSTIPTRKRPEASSRPRLSASSKSSSTNSGT